MGDYVFWWRLPRGKSKGTWRGPGVVIGQQGESVWVSHGNSTVLVAKEQLRKAVAEELWAPGLDEVKLYDDLQEMEKRLREDAREHQFEDERGPPSRG